MASEEELDYNGLVDNHSITHYHAGFKDEASAKKAHSMRGIKKANETYNEFLKRIYIKRNAKNSHRNNRP